MMKKRIIAIAILLIGIKAEAQSSVFPFVEKLLNQGKYQEALIQLDKENPKTLEVYAKEGSIYQSVRNYSKAIESYKNALDIKENNVVRGKLGNVYELSGLVNNAIKIYEGIIAKDSTNLLIVNSLGKLYISYSQLAKAEKIFRYLKKKDSLNPNYSYQLGNVLGLLDRPFEMGDNFLEAFRIDSLHMRSIFRLAKFYKDIEDKDSTMLYIDRGLRIDKNNLNFNQLKANALYTYKDYRGAIEHLERLDSLNFVSARIYEMLGMSYSKLDKNKLALDYFDRAVIQDPKNSTLLYRKALAHYNLKDNNKTLMYLMKSIYLEHPDVYRQYYLLGVMNKENGEPKMAIENFKKSYRNNSKNYKSLFELALLSYSYYKDKKIAFELYEEFLMKFENKNSDMRLIASARMKEIKETLFKEVQVID